MRVVNGVRYVAADGTLTLDGLRLIADLSDRLALAEARLAAIAAVDAPSGGATVDTQARTAVAAVIAGAA